MRFLRYEFLRIFRDKKVILFIVFLLILSLYYISIGISEYMGFLNKKENFIAYEKQKVKQYTNYIQYGGYGFRVLYELSPVTVFFTNSTVFKDIESNVDTLEILKIYHSFKGKNLFTQKERFKDFSGIVFLFGSLFMIYMGAGMIESKNYMRFVLKQMGLKKVFFKTLFSRLFWLNMIFVLLFEVVYFFTLIRDIRLHVFSIPFLLPFLLYVLLFLNFFFFIGSLMKILSKFGMITYMWIFLFWVVSIFLIPEINRVYLFNESQKLPTNEKINIEKLKTLMDFEKKGVEVLLKKQYSSTEIQTINMKLAKEYKKNEFMLNVSREMVLRKGLRNLINYYEKTSLLYPSLYYSFVSHEISGQGFYGYMDFYDYVMKLRTEFLEYYIQKVYIKRSQKIEPFVKHNENIFIAKNHLPETYLYGILIIMCYCIILIGISYFRLRNLIYKK
jgi:hypothetical protein